MRKIDDTQKAQDALLGAYTRLNIPLQNMLADGQGDSAEADAIREEMEVVWDQMSDDTQHLTRNVSSRIGVFTLMVELTQSHAWLFNDMFSKSVNRGRKTPHSAKKET